MNIFYLASLLLSHAAPFRHGDKKMFVIRRVISALVLCTLALSSWASPIYFTDRSAFQASAGSLLLESFEGPLQGDSTLSYTGFQVSETGGGLNAVVTCPTNCITALSNALTDGSNYIWFDDNDNSIASFFNFSGGSAFAFGLDLTTHVSSSLTFGGGAVSDTLSLGANAPSFWGVVDTSGFSSITISPSGGPNIAFDNVEYRLDQITTEPPPADVPNPATIALMGLGIAGLGWKRRRKA